MSAPKSRNPHGDAVSAAAPARYPDERPTPRRYLTDELFGDRSRIVIEHGGVEYHLRITRLGKLILTK
jgi:hemin uptake protein HemP